MNFRFFARSIFFLSLIPFFSLQASHAMTVKELNNYLDRMMDDVAYYWYPYVESREVKSLRKDLYHAITEYAGAMSWFGSVSYERDLVDQYIKSGLIDFIEEKAYKVAAKHIAKKERAKKIAESMRNNALALIAKNPNLDLRSLRPFIGESLKKAIDYELHSSSSTTVSDYAPSYDHPLYPSQDCPVCFEPFGSDHVERIFLTPCGHDICKECARQWFFEASNRSSCPQCRATVDRKVLERALYR